MDVLSVIFWLVVFALLVWGGFWVIDRGMTGTANAPAKTVFAVLVLVAIVLLLFGQGPIALPPLRLRR